jgi:hypothetical protein
VTKYVGILTSGGDSPGLNAALRGVGKAALGHHRMQIIGFRDGFRGLMENRTMRLDGGELSDILTRRTILGTSRAAAELIARGRYGVMVAARGDGTRPVKLEDVAGRIKSVPVDHPWVLSARHVGTCLGDG